MTQPRRKPSNYQGWARAPPRPARRNQPPNSLPSALVPPRGVDDLLERALATLHGNNESSTSTRSHYCYLIGNIIHSDLLRYLQLSSKPTPTNRKRGRVFFPPARCTGRSSTTNCCEVVNHLACSVSTGISYAPALERVLAGGRRV